MTYRFLLAIVLIPAFIFIWWIFGFNFDYRSPGVGIAFLMSLTCWIIAVVTPINILDKKIF